MDLNYAAAMFYRAVQTSGRPRVARTAEMSDADYYAAEVRAGTPDELARQFAGLPPLSPDNE
ncbi:hypothetical protein [Micromonospora ureilytica]|uniref:Uncharacterized protein n=1 Tax=Micromonospora ureilytica TaxID=709868 RepID=A0ABS0JLE4_9ACTN|nr:hypothetical protein [Micromonospora ureilytica]MBG6067855.1 hypothetical protein [Micromonospora ureilytica]